MDDRATWSSACCVCRYFDSHGVLRGSARLAVKDGWLWRVVNRIQHGEGRPEDIELLDWYP